MKRAPLHSVVKGIDVEKRTLVIMGTTPGEDRYGDVVEPKGGNLKNFRKNPVFLWAHDYSIPPIGKSVKERITDEGIEFTIQFANTAFAQEIFGLYRDGFLSASSIGFIPHEMEPATKDGFGWRITSWDLLELSGVPVPANPEALALAMAKGFSANTLSRVFESPAISDGPPQLGVSDDGSTTEVPVSEATVEQADVIAAADPVAEPPASIDPVTGDLPVVKAAPMAAIAIHKADDADTAQLALLDQLEGLLDDVDEIAEQLRSSIEGELISEPGDASDAAQLQLLDAFEGHLDDADAVTEKLRSAIQSEILTEGKGQRPGLTRAGAVLNKQNKTRLQDAAALIMTVLSTSETQPAEEPLEPDSPIDPYGGPESGKNAPAGVAPVVLPMATWREFLHAGEFEGADDDTGGYVIPAWVMGCLCQIVRSAVGQKPTASSMPENGPTPAPAPEKTLVPASGRTDGSNQKTTTGLNPQVIAQAVALAIKSEMRRALGQAPIDE